MTPDRDAGAQTVLARLLEEHHLSNDSLLYREVERAQLLPAEADGQWRLRANDSPREAVLDVYGPGYVVQAETMGPGLAFTESGARNWQETMELRALRAGERTPDPAATGPVLVAARLGDLLAQGGLMYPVESVTVERAWYFTLPGGTIDVREVAG
jgi:hypothetical protein